MDRSRLHAEHIRKAPMWLHHALHAGQRRAEVDGRLERPSHLPAAWRRPDGRTKSVRPYPIPLNLLPTTEQAARTSAQRYRMFQTRYIAVSRSSKLYFTMPATLLCLISAIFTGGLVSATASPARSLRASAQKPHTVAKASAGHEPPAALKLASSTHPAGPDYMTEVHPLLQSHCGQCHLNGSKMGALSLDSRDSILKG